MDSMRSMRWSQTGRSGYAGRMHLTRRQILGRACGAGALFRLGRAASASEAASPTIRRLHWAGIRLEIGPVALFVDPQVVFARKPEIGSDAALLFSPPFGLMARGR